MNIDVFTLFPEHFNWFLKQRHVLNALRHGHDLRLFNYRDTTPLSHGQVDDTPYGGGAGMVIRVDVVDAALQAVYGDIREDPGEDPGGDRGQDRGKGRREGRSAGKSERTVVLAPGGRPFDDRLAQEFASLDRLTLLSGRYEGIDDRVREHLADDAVSIGRFVLSGGELPAMVIADAVMRKLPGALGSDESAVEESFSEALDGAPEYPHYTRPASYRGWDVPEVLLSGDHERVRGWRRERSSGETPGSD